MRMESILELLSLEKFICCKLNLKTGEKVFVKGIKKQEGFTGLYFKDEKTFFAIYPTIDGPIMYYKGKTYPLIPDLHIRLKKYGKGKKRVFKIKEYNICIKYKTSPYIGFDVWSQEEDVDLFYQIAINYQNEDYYKKFTK